MVKPPPKRRRILNLSAVVPVPIYSNQVELQQVHLEEVLQPSETLLVLDQDNTEL